MSAGKQKIAILGGGLAGLSAAWQLTQLPDAQNRFDITVYQMGWRLGGKCASARNREDERKALRVEEHGIHVFGGCYRQALTMMKECYDEFEKIVKKPHLTFDKAFEHQDSVTMWFRDDDGLVRPWTLRFPSNNKKPYANTQPASDVEWITQPLSLLEYWLDPANGKFSSGERKVLREGRQHIFKLKSGLSAGLPEKDSDPLHVDFKNAVKWSSDLIRLSVRGSTPYILALLTNFMVALIWGVLRDRLLSKGFDRIDDKNFDDWLEKHGAMDETLNSPFVLSSPNVLFAYPMGDTSKRPRMGAGCFAHWTLKTLRYARSYMWLFAGGTGETIISPLYLTLKARGVRFAFFHKVEKLRYRETKSGPELFEIDIAVQAKPKASAYDPLIQPWPKINGRDWPCWPDIPNYNKLKKGQALEKALNGAETHLESYWNKVQPADQLTLKLDSGAPANERFDTAILAISRGALPVICDDLVNREAAWAKMIERVPTTPTQAAQIWLEPSMKELNRDLRARRRRVLVGATYFSPMSGHIDFSRLIEVEKWPANNRPKSLIYFCGAMADRHAEAPLADASYPKLMRERALWQTYERLQNSALPMLPGSARSGPTARDPLGLDFDDLVCDPKSKETGLARLDYQYTRSNFEPSERYVLSPPNSTKSRLLPYNSGFQRLFLAGDWTYSGLNVSCVEATVASGTSAALGAAGEPNPDAPLRQISW